MNQAKILLISANRFKDPYPVYPLGLAYLQAAINQHLPGLDIHMCDMNLTSHAGLELLLDDIKPQYVGISLRNVDDVNSLVQNYFINDYRDLINLVRKRIDTVVIIGGAGFSIYPQLLFRELKPDYAVYGEGENALCELLKCLQDGTSPKDIEGLVWMDNGQVIQNPRTRFSSTPGISFDTGLLDYYWKKSGMLNVQTKRGCPYQCIYCTYPLIEGRRVRTLDIGRIVDNLYDLYHQKRIDYVFFTDSVFNIANDFNIKLCEAIIRSGIRIRWGAYFTPCNLDLDMLKLFKEAGLTHVEFGTESLSNTQLKNYGKRFTFDDVQQVSDLCVKAGVYYAHFLILGGYGETDSTIAETFEHSRYLRDTVFFPFIGMRIYPGTKLQEIAIAEGKITREDPLIEPSYYISDKFDQSTLKQLAAGTNKAWFFPDEPEHEIVSILRDKKNKKGPIWEYLRKS